MNNVALHSGYLPILSLCAGVGGLELGVHLACPGARTVGFVEREAYAAAALVARMEESALGWAPVWDDLVAFDGGPWRGKVALVTAGFPCQPFSVAGQRKGTDDERWLWDDIARILREVGPRYVFLENVSGLLQFRGGIGRVLGDLAEMGFDAEWGCFRASSVGAPHRRERVFILAARRGDGGGGVGVPDAVGAAVRVEPGRGGGPDGPGAAEPGHVGEGLLADDLAGRGRVAAGDGPDGELEVEPGHDTLGQDSGLPGGCGDGPVADAADGDGRSRERGAQEGAGSGEERRGGSPGGGAGVADAEDDGCAVGTGVRVARSDLLPPEQGAGGGSEGGASEPRGRVGALDRSGSGGGLADAGGAGLPRPELIGEPRASGEGPGEGGPAAPELRGARGGGEPGDGLVGLPPFPPGPGDRDFWETLLRDFPELAPAVAREDVEGAAWVPGGERAGRQRVLDAGAEGGGGNGGVGGEGADPAGEGEALEPPLRGLADGLAAALACRADALRAAGNGVVGLQAAAALVVLARRLGVNPGVWPDLWDALPEDL